MNKYPSYFLGQIVVDEKQNVKQEGHGVRYRVLRVGIDDPSLIKQPERLRMFDCLLPVTAGAGDGQKMRSVNLNNGDMVFGLHTDSPKNDTGIILGVIARTSLINYDDYVKTDDLTTASGGDQGGKTTQPQPVNRGRKGGQSNTADSEAEKNAVKQYKKNNAKSDATATAPPITVNTLPPGWRVVEGGFVEQNDGRIVGNVNEDGTINTG
jgi:hypothetical protein